MIEQEVLTYMLVSRDDSLIHLTRDYFLVYGKEFDYLKAYYTEHNSLPTMQMFLDEFHTFEVEATGRSRDLLLDTLYNYLDEQSKMTEVYQEIVNVDQEQEIYSPGGGVTDEGSGFTENAKS